MRVYLFNYKIISLILMWLISLQKESIAQNDTSIIKRIPADSSKKLNMDAVYNRPFLSAGKLPIAIGGYMEANTNYAATDGISDGFSFQMRRFTLFFSSTVAKRIRFLSELEFEDGTKEINLEFAAMDIEMHPMLNLRGGILMNPIGAFNQNHDGPRWDFIDRPISATSIVPSTLSNVGFGLYGKYFSHNWILGYEMYLSNGFNDAIISNESNRTSLAAGKSSPEKFEESNSGLPMFTGKMAIRNRKYGEIGLSYMSGVYNKFQADGLIIDNKRSVNVFAFDFNASLMRNRLSVNGEYDLVMTEIPLTYSQNYGNKQSGFYLDIIGTVLQKPMFGWNNAKLNLVLRTEYVDYNMEKFRETGEKIGDEIFALVPGIAFRPVGTTVIRFNYRFVKETDILRNVPSRTGVIQFGFSTYF